MFIFAGIRSTTAAHLLEGLQGYLQTDDYAGYHAVGRAEGVTHLGCWAHARRKFVEAQRAVKPKGKKQPSGRVDVALRYIGKLYTIERAIKGESAEVRYATRQSEARPILDEFKAWLDKAMPHVLPKGVLGRAIAYLNKNWDKLNVYLEDGRLSIDNNIAENAIRPFVVGRKNWLFADTPKGAHASAALYSLIETAKANGLEPYAYLLHVFKELPKAKTVENIEVLLPWNLDDESLMR